MIDQEASRVSQEIFDADHIISNVAKQQDVEASYLHGADATAFLQEPKSPQINVGIEDNTVPNSSLQEFNELKRIEDEVAQDRHMTSEILKARSQGLAKRLGMDLRGQSFMESRQDHMATSVASLAARISAGGRTAG